MVTLIDATGGEVTLDDFISALEANSDAVALRSTAIEAVRAAASQNELLQEYQQKLIRASAALDAAVRWIDALPAGTLPAPLQVAPIQIEPIKLEIEISQSTGRVALERDENGQVVAAVRQ